MSSIIVVWGRLVSIVLCGNWGHWKQTCVRIPFLALSSAFGLLSLFWASVLSRIVVRIKSGAIERFHYCRKYLDGVDKCIKYPTWCLAYSKCSTNVSLLSLSFPPLHCQLIHYLTRSNLRFLLGVIFSAVHLQKSSILSILKPKQLY